ncbi:MAG: hypothetical protein WC628_05695 [Candidatus Omnitrophota bacterium]
MSAKDNYSYKKYQKELAKKKKREEKQQVKLAKKNMQAKTELVLTNGNSGASATPSAEDSGQVSNEGAAAA